MANVKNYAVRFHGGPKGTGTDIRAQVHLFDDRNRMLGWVDFYTNGYDLPEDRQTAEHIILSMHSEFLVSVVDMLRNEEPVFLYWQPKIQNAYLGTGQEPVGEGE
ncbi:MAG: hypothetical protein H6581_25255 [Bacteroidia bacterium]|nr:hypothetical protein [Bacteroidia bacterium]